MDSRPVSVSLRGYQMAMEAQFMGNLLVVTNFPEGHELWATREGQRIRLNVGDILLSNDRIELVNISQEPSIDVVLRWGGNNDVTANGREPGQQPGKHRRFVERVLLAMRRVYRALLRQDTKG